MNGVETFGFSQTHVERFHRAQLETGVIDSLDNVTRVTGAYRVGLDDSKCKIAHLLLSDSLPVLFL